MWPYVNKQADNRTCAVVQRLDHWENVRKSKDKCWAISFNTQTFIDKENIYGQLFSVKFSRKQTQDSFLGNESRSTTVEERCFAEWSLFCGNFCRTVFRIRLNKCLSFVSFFSEFLPFFAHFNSSKLLILRFLFHHHPSNCSGIHPFTRLPPFHQLANLFFSGRFLLFWPEFLLSLADV